MRVRSIWDKREWEGHSYRMNITLLCRTVESAWSLHVVSSGQYKIYACSSATNERTMYSPDIRMGPAPPAVNPFRGESSFLALFSNRLAWLDIRKRHARIAIHSTYLSQESHDLLFRSI